MHLSAVTSPRQPPQSVSNVHPGWMCRRLATCQPSIYLSTYERRLAAGTYYWWLTFYKTDPGNLFSTLHISGPLVFTVPQPTAPAGVSLVAPADGRRSQRPPGWRCTFRLAPSSTSTLPTRPKG